MGAKGGGSPGPWSQYEARTTFLRVPSLDWAGVKIGAKTEFRAGENRVVTQLANIHCPTPVVAYTLRPGGQYDSRLMVLTKTWREPLGAISEESLQREGFPDMAGFRRYWILRTHRRFAPLKHVQVYRLAKLTEAEIPDLGAVLLKRLYRDHL